MQSHDEMINEPVYSIGIAAEKLNISVPTLRMYEQAGLIIPHRTATNRRLYSRNDLDRVQVMIDLIRNQHLSIESIKYIYSLVPCWKIMGCKAEVRDTCCAYRDSKTPCWLKPTPPCAPSPEFCRKCPIYIGFPNLFQNAKEHFKQFME